MERTEVLDMMSGLKLYGMRSAYDETLATAIKRKHEPQRFVGDLLKAEISEKQARSIKYQLTVAKLPLAKDVDDFAFKNTPINEALVRDLAGGAFITQQRNVVLVGGTGTGKTHLAIAIARSCIRSGSRGRFFTTVDLVNQLEAEGRAGRQGRTLTTSPASTSLSWTNWVISPSLKRAADCCSISSAGSMSAPQSSSPPTSPSANGQASSVTQR
jgi:DNA replication protein DnaC